MNRPHGNNHNAALRHMLNDPRLLAVPAAVAAQRVPVFTLDGREFKLPQPIELPLYYLVHAARRGDQNAIDVLLATGFAGMTDVYGRQYWPMPEREVVAGATAGQEAAKQAYNDRVAYCVAKGLQSLKCPDCGAHAFFASPQGWGSPSPAGSMRPTPVTAGGPGGAVAICGNCGHGWQVTELTVEAGKVGASE